MLFQIQSTTGKFIFYIKGTGEIKVCINDDQEVIIPLPGKISIDSMKNKTHKIQINNINAKGITIGPVLEGYITEIESWSDLDIIRLENIFSKNKNHEVIVPDYIPKSLKNLSYLLYDSGVSKLKGMEKWNVSHVTDTRYMFYGAKSFNQDISEWNTSSVIDMHGMFYGAENFNGDVSKWDTSSVEDMSFMFYGATSFNRDISKWDTSSVIDMSYMFFGATNFNQDISRWDTSSVIDMNRMFYRAEKFNQDISNWNISKLKSITGMLVGAEKLDPEISTKFVTRFLDICDINHEESDDER